MAPSAKYAEPVSPKSGPSVGTSVVQSQRTEIRPTNKPGDIGTLPQSQRSETSTRKGVSAKHLCERLEALICNNETNIRQVEELVDKFEKETVREKTEGHVHFKNFSTPAKRVTTNNTPASTSAFERDDASYEGFGPQQGKKVESNRQNRENAEKEAKFKDLKSFGEKFRLHSPVPSDIVSIVGLDAKGQKSRTGKKVGGPVGQEEVDSAITAREEQ